MLESNVASRIAAARAGDSNEFSGLTEPYRHELEVHCYRMLGSLQEAEDLVQETFLRAWRRLETFEGRASLRAWLYRIATNACLDMLEKRPRRTLPARSQPPAEPSQPPAPPLTELIWLEPFPDDLLDDVEPTPEARYAIHESITLAFLTALQLLPPRQRAVLLMRDVLDWSASEVAKLLDMTIPAVNSALHRARVTLSRNYTAERPASLKLADPATRALLDRYVEAWEQADVPGLLALLREDVTVSMPPSPTWYLGRAALGAVAEGMIFAGEARGRFRLRLTRANGQPAFGFYRRDEAEAKYRAESIQVVSLADDAAQIKTLTSFFDARLFARFGLPPELAPQV
jgi:RNA polymerase sigma-70 factor (ECF subfamily)